MQEHERKLSDVTENERILRCPMGGGHGGLFRQCAKEGCAWWTEYGCAAAVSATALRDVVVTGVVVYEDSF